MQWECCFLQGLWFAPLVADRFFRSRGCDLRLWRHPSSWDLTGCDLRLWRQTGSPAEFTRRTSMFLNGWTIFSLSRMQWEWCFSQGLWVAPLVADRFFRSRGLCDCLGGWKPVNYIKSFFDISKINNINVLCLDKTVRQSIAYGANMWWHAHAYMKYNGKSRGWNFRSVSVKCGLCDWLGGENQWTILTFPLICRKSKILICYVWRNSAPKQRIWS